MEGRWAGYKNYELGRRMSMRWFLYLMRSGREAQADMDMLRSAVVR